MSKSTRGGYSAGKTRQLAGMAIFTAIVVVLQLLGTFVRFGPFSISLVLVPIVIGAALYGAKAGAWLGFVFGVVVCALDAGAFLAVNVLGTIVTCIAKGALAGFCAGLVYKAFEKKSDVLAAAAAAVVCPAVNTGVFLIGCFIFFLPTVSGWAEASGFANVGSYMIFGLVGLNFVFEMAVNAILAPVIVRLVKLAKKMHS